MRIFKIDGIPQRPRGNQTVKKGIVLLILVMQTVILSDCQNVRVSDCQTFMLSDCHAARLSNFQTVRL